MRFFDENKFLTSDEREKFKEIQKMVWLGLHEQAKSMEQLEKEKERKIPGDVEQEKFRTQSVWHNKTDLDRFVAKRLNLHPDKWGTDKSKNIFYQKVVSEISKLREEEKIVDLKHNRRTGIWRLNTSDMEEKEQAISKCEEGDYSCPRLEGSIIRRYKQPWFRDALLKEYDHKCAFCGFEIEDYLRGAHIVPFSVMQDEDPDNAMNPSNGLLLCALCDISFEKGDIRVNEDFQIIGDKKLQELSETNPAIKSWISNINDKLDIKTSAKFKPDVKFLKWKTELV